MSAFNNLDKEVQRRLRNKAKQYDTVKQLIYRLRGSSRYSLSFEDVKDVVFWGMDTKDVKVQDVYTKIFNN